MSEISLSKAGLSPPPVGEREKLYASLGPGLITGAVDDDPSGIATYFQVGAQFGFAMLWTMLFSFPLMAAIQEICARLGRITGMGVAANLALSSNPSDNATLVMTGDHWEFVKYSRRLANDGLADQSGGRVSDMRKYPFIVSETLAR